MYIEKEYSHHRKDFVDYFCLNITVKTNSQSCVTFLRNTDNLVDKDSVWISIENLANEEFLKQNDIEYTVEENQSTKEKDIIPIGLFEFNDNDKFRYGELLLWHVGSKDLYKSEYIVKNIEKAIKIKYEALKFKDKCIKKWKEEISLD